MDEAKRECGVLLHVSSLPSPWGIGSLGEDARRFADFLAEAGQGLWQILPLGPTGYGDSPYQSFSTFAGNPYLIDLDTLASDGLLEREEYASLPWGDDPGKVDFAALSALRLPVLRRACARFFARGGGPEYEAFLRREAFWLEDYAAFMALKEAHGGRPWRAWEAPLRRREALPDGLAPQADFWRFVQYEFDAQWRALRAYANGRGVRILGDLPIYVADDSADVWADPGLFDLDETLTPRSVSGVPPDYFSASGQLWGNPVYNWEAHRAEGYRWWLRRLESCRSRFDLLRIDHFRGFESYYCVPWGAADARGGVWRKGPGMELFSRVKRELDGFPIIAEDLGLLTPQVRELLADCGFPGMRVLEFAFGGGADNESLPHNLPRGCVCYPGTHDNLPAAGWIASAPAPTREHCLAYLGRDAANAGFAESFLRLALGSVADRAVVQMQDWLGLGAAARMNEPATLSGNWRWRLTPGQASGALASRMRALSRLYGRCG